MSEFIIGFLLGVISMLKIFPEHRTFWNWIWNMIKEKTHGRNR